jgi:hypothetical protein
MAQEDKGLVIRGLFLLAAIGGLVTFVLAVIFWRPDEPRPVAPAPEPRVPMAIVPALFTDYPASVPWGAMCQLGETLPSAPGWEVRYNAATTLARRGSARVPWGIIHEMLDENQQMRNYRVRHPDGHDVYDEAAARSNMISALKALTAWHEKQPTAARSALPPELREIYAQVDRLTESPFPELKLQAEKARATFVR